jgi:hypothetical protein
MKAHNWNGRREDRRVERSMGEERSKGLRENGRLSRLVVFGAKFSKSKTYLNLLCSILQFFGSQIFPCT